MSPLDNQLIIRKAKLIETDLNKLKEFDSVTLQEYVDSLEARLQVERLLERIIGRVIHINYHLLKEKYTLMPQDYHQSFILLAQHQVLPLDFAQKLALSTGLRNALAHEYDAIDDNQIYASIKLCLNQIPRYLEYILRSSEN